MSNFMKWLGMGLQTEGSIVWIGFKGLVFLGLVWLIWTILENF